MQLSRSVEMRTFFLPFQCDMQLFDEPSPDRDHSHVLIEPRPGSQGQHRKAMKVPLVNRDKRQ